MKTIVLKEPLPPGVSIADPNEPILRDQFAMAALTGMLANGTLVEGLETLGVRGAERGAEHITGRAYEYADAMLKERAKVRE